MICEHFFSSRESRVACRKQEMCYGMMLVKPVVQKNADREARLLSFQADERLLDRALQAAQRGDSETMQQMVLRLKHKALCNHVPHGCKFGLLHHCAWHGRQEDVDFIMERIRTWAPAELPSGDLISAAPATSRDGLSPTKIAAARGHHALAAHLERHWGCL